MGGEHGNDQLLISIVIKVHISLHNLIILIVWNEHPTLRDLIHNDFPIGGVVGSRVRLENLPQDR